MLRTIKYKTLFFKNGILDFSDIVRRARISKNNYEWHFKKLITKALKF